MSFLRIESNPAIVESPPAQQTVLQVADGRGSRLMSFLRIESNPPHTDGHQVADGRGSRLMSFLRIESNPAIVELPAASPVDVGNRSATAFSSQNMAYLWDTGNYESKFHPARVFQQRAWPQCVEQDCDKFDAWFELPHLFKVI